MILIMSLNNDFVWATCPTDILIIVFEKLDIESVVSCMAVNTFWRDVVEYYFEHMNLWLEVIRRVIGEVTFTEKSVLGWRDKLQSAQQWLDVSKATVCNVSLQHHKFQTIENICVYRDNLIVTTETATTYYNINNFEVIKTVQQYAPKKLILGYKETSSLIVKLKSNSFGRLVLSLTNKLCTEPFDSNSVQKIKIESPIIYKVNLDSCYVIHNNVLWKYTAKVNRWNSQWLAKYYGSENLLCSIHLHREDVYVALKSGQVLFVDFNLKSFTHKFDYRPLKKQWNLLPLIFYSSLQSNSLNTKPCEYTDDNVKNVCTDEITCVLEHGHAVIFGYKDGEIEIYLNPKLIESEEPELKFNLRTYLNDITELKNVDMSDASKDKQSLFEIKAIEVYEDNKGHHLFVSTLYYVHELLLRY